MKNILTKPEEGERETSNILYTRHMRSNQEAKAHEHMIS